MIKAIVFDLGNTYCEGSLNDFLRRLDYSNKQFKNFRMLSTVEKKALLNICTPRVGHGVS